MPKKKIHIRSDCQSHLTGILKRAIRGLIYRSEADYPFEVISWPREEVKELDSKTLLRYEKYPPGTRVKMLDFDFFFEVPTTPEEWHDAEERKQVSRYQQLVKLLKDNLSDLRVFKVGEVQVDIYVGGRSETGDWVGLYTNSVET
jgi:hypothetical protein